jgi:outer membrane protein assembly factor BamB
MRLPDSRRYFDVRSASRPDLIQGTDRCRLLNGFASMGPLPAAIPRWLSRRHPTAGVPALKSPIACPVRFQLLTLFVCVVVNPQGVRADWPQWRGPNRDDLSTEQGLLKEWPAEGPKLLWTYADAGVGYSGPAIVGGTLFTLGTRGENEVLLAIDVRSGQERWSQPVGEVLGNNWGDGPRSTPTVDGQRVYTLGAKGTLTCSDAATGEPVWSKSMLDLGGKTPTWGYCESPIIYGETVICTPGGEQGAIAAFNKETGEVVWRSTELVSQAHYASIVTANRNREDELVQLLPDQLVGVSAKSGKTLWTHPWPLPTAAIPTPIVRGNFVYATSGYGVGSTLIEVTPEYSVDEKYKNKVMKNKHGGVILVGDHLYGYSDDIGWVCQEFETGDRVWREREALEMGAVAYADGMLYCVGQKQGDVVLIEASPEGWKEHGRFRLTPQSELRKPEGGIWTHPVICAGKLYLRDQNLIYCFDVRDPAVRAGN